MDDSPAISRTECFRRIEAMYATYVKGEIAGSEHEKALSWLKSCVDPSYSGWEACVAPGGRASRSRLLELLEDLGMDVMEIRMQPLTHYAYFFLRKFRS